MSTTQNPQSGHWLQIGGLRIDLEEGEQLLSAIHGGEVDGIVVHHPEGARVYTLKGADESFRLVIERMNEGALILGTDGGVLYCNRKCAMLLDLPLERIVGSDFAGYARAHHQKRLSRLLQEGREGRCAKVELSLTRAGTESLVPVLVSISPLDLQGTAALCAVVTDLTEQKQTEAALRRLEQLAAAGRLAARVAHEINNPLGGIKNAFQLIKGDLPDGHRYSAYVPRIDREIDRITQVVRRMFNLCRPEEDDQSQALADIVADVVTLQELSCEKAAIRIEMHVCPTCADASMPSHPLRQVLYNLIGNAIDVSPNGGVVRVAAHTAPEDRIAVTVSDDGPGIPEEVQPFIFEPFFTTKKDKRNSGLGLGLSICRNLIADLDGTLTFETRPGQGTTFAILIPVAPAGPGS